MASTDSLGIDVTTEDGTLVGSSNDPAQAVALACAVYGLTGQTLEVAQDGVALAWLGTREGPPAPVGSPMTLSGSADAEDPLLWRFRLGGAPADADLDYGDGTSETVSAEEFEHSFPEAGTYRVVAISGADLAEVYAAVSPAIDLHLALLSLAPPSAEVGGEDVTLHVNGQGYLPGCTIVFNGGDEATVYVSDTEVTTLVKPSLAGAAVSVPVQVRNADGGLSNSLYFEFFEPVEPPPE